MGIKVLIFSLVFLLLYCESTTDKEIKTIDWTSGKTLKRADKSKCPELLQKKYYRDAATLALRDVHDYDSLRKYTLVSIPKELIELYNNGLLHIYNSLDIPACDSVVTMYEIHAHPYPEINEILVSVNSNADWIKNWEEGRRLTGNNDIDNGSSSF